MAKTYTTVADKSVGDVFTEAMWDDYIKTNTNNLIVPPSCRVYHSANQSLSNTTDTTLAFNSERFDTDSMHDTVTNNSRITIQTAGIYLLSATVSFEANGTGVRVVWLRLNGATKIAQQSAVPPGVNTTDITIQTVYDLAAADYVQVLAYQSCGSPMNVTRNANYSPEFMAMWMGKSS